MAPLAESGFESVSMPVVQHPMMRGLEVAYDTKARNVNMGLKGPGALANFSITGKYANDILEKLERFNYMQLTKEENLVLKSTDLRAKPKHSNAILFSDDYNFVFRTEHKCRVEVGPEAAKDQQQYVKRDWRYKLLRQATQDVMDAYKLSIEHSTTKSCIFSALLHRVAYHLQQSNVPNVHLKEFVEGVAHKENTLFIDTYHISRSNFTKIVRQIIKRKAAEAAKAGALARATKT